MRKSKRNRGAEDAPIPKSRITDLLDIPANAMVNVPQIEMAGNREALVDGCQGVLEYDENIIRLIAGSMTIKFVGRGLQIKVLTHSSAVVAGFITSVEFT